jgi:hypothetical protein
MKILISIEIVNSTKIMVARDLLQIKFFLEIDTHGGKNCRLYHARTFINR